MIAMKGNRRHNRVIRELVFFSLGWFFVVYYMLCVHHSSVNMSVINEKEDILHPEPSKDRRNAAIMDTPLSCASWIPLVDRKVLFVELHTWDMYYGPSKYKTGEYYVSATWDYALRRNGFQVDRVSTRHFFERMTPSEMRSYYRIFIRDPKWHTHFSHHDILCRTRPMYYFGEWFQNKVKDNSWFMVPFDQKQILAAHPEEFNTFLGYFPHELLTNTTIPRAERGRIGLLYGKKPEYFAPYQTLIRRLIAEGFELHSTCTDHTLMKCPFPTQVIQHQNLGPAEYSMLLNRFSFMLGFQKVSENMEEHSLCGSC